MFFWCFFTMWREMEIHRSGTSQTVNISSPLMKLKPLCRPCAQPAENMSDDNRKSFGLTRNISCLVSTNFLVQTSPPPHPPVKTSLNAPLSSKTLFLRGQTVKNNKSGYIWLYISSVTFGSEYHKSPEQMANEAVSVLNTRLSSLNDKFSINVTVNAAAPYYPWTTVGIYKTEATHEARNKPDVTTVHHTPLLLGKVFYLFMYLRLVRSLSFFYSFIYL